MAAFRELAVAIDRHDDGPFLSGGTDSSTVCGMLGQITGTPTRAYSIGFEAEGYDEMEYARIAARHFGCDHHEYYVTPADLAASLPAADEAWIAAFARGFFACSEAFGIDVIGGDTTRGPLNLCPTIFGEVPVGQAITRAGARPGDDLWISGAPGRAALGLAQLRGEATLAGADRAGCLAALHRPQPRVALGLALRGLASSLLDVSDGLLGDLGHILEQSAVGAVISAGALPLAPLEAACGDAALAFRACTAGGDDYELLFTAPVARRAEVGALAERLHLPLYRIGSLTPAEQGLRLRDHDGQLRPLAANGYDHFGR